MSKAKDITPKQVVMRVLGVGSEAADGVLSRMGDKAKDLPAQYAAGTVRDFITTHNVKSAKPAEKSEPKPEPK